jgi:hypothetical protein
MDVIATAANKLPCFDGIADLLLTHWMMRL